MPSARLVLGTAQLGMAYGVANRHGAPDSATAAAIVQAAWDGGVREFDTARAYGDSEAVLGRALRDLGLAGAARIVTKTDPAWDGQDAGQLRRDVEESLRRLGVERVSGLLLHRENLLERWDGGLGAMLRGLVDQGLVERVGVSVYSAAATHTALALDGMGLIQLPSNILDRRFEAAGIFAQTAQQGATVHVRSVFLQGLLLMDPQQVPQRLSGARGVVEEFQLLAAAYGLTPPEAALGYATRAYAGAGVLFGAETAEQVRANLAAASRGVTDAFVAEARRRFAAVPEQILNPSLWGQ